MSAFLSSFGILCASTVASAAASAVPRGPQVTQTLAPSIVLNEILFDPAGQAGTEATWQWIELYAKEGTRTAGIELRNASGALIYALPDIRLPSNQYLLVLIGPKDPSLENRDASAGPIRFTTGHGWGDQLGVSAGGVKLVRGGTVLDQIHWGTTPFGFPFLNLSFGTGTPSPEGDSIGRDSRSTYTGSVHDWAIAGGSQANGPTPGTQNIVELADETDCVLYQDDSLNAILAALSQSYDGPGWLQVTATAPTLVSYTPHSPTPDSATAVVEHVLDITVYAQAIRLSGRVTTIFSRCAQPYSTSESWTTRGSINSSDGLWGLEVDIQRGSAGAHSAETTVSSSTRYSWTHNGTVFDATVAGTRREHQSAPDKYLGSDTRTATDWGGAGTKTGSCTWTQTHEADGTWHVAYSVARSFPSLLPSPGADQSWSNGMVENLVEELRFCTSGLGLTTGTVLSLNQSVGGTLLARLRPGRFGSLRFTQQATTTGQGFLFQSTIPLEDAVANPTDRVMTLAGATMDAGTKTVSVGRCTVAGNGILLWTTSFAIDPPMQSSPPTRTFWQRVRDFGVTTVTCVAGGVASEVLVSGAAGKKAVAKVIGKAVAKKLIPVVGWVCTGLCVGQAIGDQF